MHIVWRTPPVPGHIVEASATLEVIEAPIVPELWFWALQASFGRAGGAHLGLQWYDRYPGSTAANFGGYDNATGVELVGPGENTVAFAWEPHRPYRLTIADAGEGTWSGSIDGVELRRLSCAGTAEGLHGLMVWTECFARCDAPSASVRWTDFEIVAEPGTRVPVHDVSLNYQSVSDGGCSTGRSERDGDGGWRQTTGVPRLGH